MSEEKIKEYTNGEITVVWKPNSCIHSTNCWKGLISVFNPKERPWVKMEGASTSDIIAQIEKCPSGALTWYRNDEKRDQEESTVKTRIEVVPNGPIRVHGDIEIMHSDGSTEQRERLTAFCRCGMSSRKPFCDGTHKREAWKE